MNKIRHYLVFFLTILQHICYVNGVPPSSSRIHLSPSLANAAEFSPANSEQPVDPVKDPDWAGELDIDDCHVARLCFAQRIPDPMEKRWFWSPRWITEPASPSFELPFGIRYNSCTLLARMGKDFGDGILPLQFGGFYRGYRAAPIMLLRWGDITWPVTDLLRIVQATKHAAWTTAENQGGNNVVVILMPSSSNFAQRWASGSYRQTGLSILDAKAMVGNGTDGS